jgi:hypothetical protein
MDASEIVMVLDGGGGARGCNLPLLARVAAAALLFPLLSKLLHLAPQTVEVWVNHGLRDAALSQFPANSAAATTVDADALYKRLFSHKFIAQKLEIGSKDHEPAALGCYSSGNMGKVEYQRGMRYRKFCSLVLVARQVCVFLILFVQPFIAVLFFDVFTPFFFDPGSGTERLQTLI